MKVECPVCGGRGFIVVPCHDDTCEQRPCDTCKSDGWIEPSTSDLIAELERRRPDCNKCDNLHSCLDGCIWHINPIPVDNFKEAV